MENENGVRRFPFPFQPYPIQERFMEALYAVLEQGKVGIFESPTGTGKSLSLICGALTWLKDSEEKERQEAARLLGHAVSASADGGEDNRDGMAVREKESGADGELDWVSQFVQKREEREMVNKLKDEEMKRKRREDRLEMIRHNAQLKYAMKRKNCETSETEKLLQFSKQDEGSEEGAEEDEDHALVVADYESDNEAAPKNRVCDDEDEDDDDDDLEEKHVTKLRPPGSMSTQT